MATHKYTIILDDEEIAHIMKKFKERDNDGIVGRVLDKGDISIIDYYIGLLIYRDMQKKEGK